jgi:hypothetical protein
MFLVTDIRLVSCVGTIHPLSVFDVVKDNAYDMFTCLQVVIIRLAKHFYEIYSMYDSPALYPPI